MGTFFLAVLDFLTVLCILYLAASLRENIVPLIFRNAPPFTLEPLKHSWIVLLWMLILAYNGGYTQRFTFWDEVKFLWNSVFLISIIIFTVLFIRKLGGEFSRALIINMVVLALVLHPPIRVLSKRLLYRLGLMRKKLVIVGTGEAARTAMLAIKNEPNLGYEVAGFIDDGTENPGRVEGMKVHQFVDGIDRYIKACAINDVLIAKPELEREALVSLINRVQHLVENTLYIPDIAGTAVLGVQIRHFFGKQALVLEVKNQLARPLKYISKRVMDYMAGIALFLLLALPMLAVGMLIKLTSRGPAIFKQERIGRHGRSFMCYKFRTMYEDAEDRLKDILASDEEARAYWEGYRKLKEDPRVTRLGRFLRRTSLDELPQILNILKGEMSLVGPRPYLPDERIAFKDSEDLILIVPPGITGLWQVSGRSGLPYEERLNLDLWYVRNWSVWLDIVILLKTIRAVLKAKGAY